MAAVQRRQKERGWDYPLNKDHDRFVIAVGHETPDTVAVHLAKAFSRAVQERPHTMPQDQRNALDRFKALIKASWKRILRDCPKKQDIEAILDLAVVLKFDFDGPDFTAGRIVTQEQRRPEEKCQSRLHHARA